MDEVTELGEEYIVRTLTNGLCAVIADNPGLITSIQDGLKKDEII